MCPYIITKLLQAVAMSPLFLSNSHSPTAWTTSKHTWVLLCIEELKLQLFRI